jgi:uncharacterized protein
MLRLRLLRRQTAKSLPGSEGEHLLQEAYGTTVRANSFYRRQLLDRLNPRMREFISRQGLMFVATADGRGECDCSVRAGNQGFVRTLDDRTVLYPEYRGNGVMGSLGNMTENPHVGLLFVDFHEELIGLHVNGHARIVELGEVNGHGAPVVQGGPRPERYVQVSVEEAYIHCRKHLPRMVPMCRSRRWGTDDPAPKGGDYFGAAAEPRQWGHSGDS